MTQLRFALAQIDTCVGALDANAAKVLDYRLSVKPPQETPKWLFSPEMTLTGYPIEDLALRRTFRQAAWDKANELATQLNDDGLGDLFVVVGTAGTDRKTSRRAAQPTDPWSCTKGGQEIVDEINNVWATPASARLMPTPPRCSTTPVKPPQETPKWLFSRK